jgi:deoxyuridine 5'-triphosphate nucleotidohydrolase
LNINIILYTKAIIIMSLLRVQLLSEHANIPTLGSSLAAGYDLYSAYDYVIEPRDRCLVKTDVAVGIPADCYARIAARSGLAIKQGILVGGGVVDKDYVGGIGAVLFNHTDIPFVIRRGDRVAQLILEKIHYADISIVDSLESTERGDKGYGSTGV